jgi:hypothetical protein
MLDSMRTAAPVVKMQDTGQPAGRLAGWPLYDARYWLPVTD